MLTCPKGEVVHALYEAAVESSRVTGFDSTAFQRPKTGYQVVK